MKNNKVKFFLLTCSTLVIIIASIFLFRKVSYGLLTSASDHNYWDGTTVSSSLSGSGTEASPYLISNGADFAKFIENCNSTSEYSKYYKLTADIYLNKGYFLYYHQYNCLMYLFNDTYKFIIDDNIYYNDPLMHTSNGHINEVDPISNFRSYLDGDNHSVIGLFVSGTDENTSFIKEMKTDKRYIKNINFLNSAIVGPQNVGFIGDFNKGRVENVIFNGCIYNNGIPYSYNYESGIASYNNNRISLSIAPETDESIYHHLEINGTSNIAFTYNNQNYNAGSFSIIIDSPADFIDLTPNGGTLSITNLSYKGYKRKESNCGFVAKLKRTGDSLNLNSISLHGFVSGWGNAGALVGKVEKSSAYNIIIHDVYNNATIYSENIVGGLFGYTDGATTYNLNRIYNNGKIQGRISGGIIGYMNCSINNTGITLENIFNSAEEFSDNGQIIGKMVVPSGNTISSFNVSNVYFIHSGKLGLGNNNSQENNYTDLSTMTYKSRDELLTISNLNAMGYSSSIGYNVNDGKIPYFTKDDVDAPVITIDLNYKSMSWTNTDYHNPINNVVIGTGSDYNLKYSYTDDSEIGCIRYDFDDTGYYFTNDELLTFDTIFENTSNESTKRFSINTNSVNTLIVNVIDKFGNVGLARSDNIINDPYEINESEGVNHNSISLNNNNGNSLGYDNLINSNIQLNYHINHELTTSFFPYDSSAKLYFKSRKILPNSTELYLYDYKTDNVYKLIINSQINPININNIYYYDLSLFTSIYNSSINYDSFLINHYNDSKISEDFEIVINYEKAFESGSNLMEIGNSIIVMDDNNNKYENMYEMFYSICSKENHNSYNITTTANRTLDLKDNNTNMTIDYSISDNVNNYVNNNSNYIYDEINNYTTKYLKIELVDTNGNKISNFVPFNIKYELNNTTYHSSGNSTTYIPIASDTGTITATVINNNNIDVPSGNYNIKVTVCNKYNSEISGSSTVPIVISNASPINNNSFQVEIDAKDRIIDKNTGITNSNDNNFDIHYKYTGTLNSPMVRIKINKLTDSSNSYTLSNINPNTIFNQNFNNAGTYNGETYYHLLSSYLSSNQQYNISIPIKTSSLPEGKYIISVALFNSTRVSEEKFNVIIK